MLVAALDVHVGNSILHHSRPTRPGLEPHVDDVKLFAQVFPTAVLAFDRGRNDVLHVMRVPGIGAMHCEQLDYQLVCVLRAQRLIAAFAEEDRNGHTPHALTRDAPVGTSGHHVGNALFSPSGIPLRFPNLIQSALTQR